MLFLIVVNSNRAQLLSLESSIFFFFSSLFTFFRVMKERLLVLHRLWSDPSRNFSNLLQSCLSNNSLPKAKQLHSIIVTSGVSSDRFVSNHLINLYYKMGHMTMAEAIFDAMPRKNLMTWNIMVGGYVQNGDLGSARKMFADMPERNVASWSAMVSGVTDFGFNEEGLDLFIKMRRGGFVPDEYTLGSILRGCAGIKDVGSGRQIHANVVRFGLRCDLCVASSLAHMYMNCGFLEEGERVVEDLPVRNVVSCNTVIAGRLQNGYAEGALLYFHLMKSEGLVPDQITFSSVVTACSELATLDQGEQIHAQVLRTGVDSVLAVRSSLVSMYSKCGCLNYSFVVFSESSCLDHVMWTAMITAYGFHGRGQEAIELFERMVKEEEIEPNDVTFLSLLHACSHSGLKERGREIFKLMTEVHGLEPKIEHYTCMVDLLGRSGSLAEAEELIESMPVDADAVIWKTLLSACKVHHHNNKKKKETDIAERAARRVLVLDPHDSGAHILLSQIHATSERWRDMSQVREHMKEKRVKKEPGMSWVELKNKVHHFSTGDTSNFMSTEIHDCLREIMTKMMQQQHSDFEEFHIII